MEKHVMVVGALQIGYGALKLIVAATIFVLVAGGGLLGGLLSGEEVPVFVTLIVGSAIAFWLALLSVSEIIGGVGLLRRKAWARYMVMVLAVLDLFNIPVGTAIGAYSIWVLVQDDTARLFGAGPCC